MLRILKEEEQPVDIPGGNVPVVSIGTTGVPVEELTCSAGHSTGHVESYRPPHIDSQQIKKALKSKISISRGKHERNMS